MLIITVILTLGLSISGQSILAAWTAPTSAPPNANVGSPVFNKSSSATTSILIDLPLSTSRNLAIAGANGLFLQSGQIGVATTTPAANLKIGVDGNIGAQNYCDKDGGNCYSILDLAQTVHTYYFLLAPSVNTTGDIPTYASTLGISSTDGMDAANKICQKLVITDGGIFKGRGTKTFATEDVKAFLCGSTYCNSLQPNSLYYFGVIGDASKGGKTFKTDSQGLAPGNMTNWNVPGAGYFEQNVDYWTGRGAGSTSLWPNTNSHNTDCTDWTSTWFWGRSGTSGGTDNTRWYSVTNNNSLCSNTKKLICLIGTGGETSNPATMAWQLDDTGQYVYRLEGSIGIGTTTPNRLLHLYSLGDNAEIDIQSVEGKDNHWGIFSDHNDNSLKFWQGSDRLTILANGKVGIGTVNPLEELEVNGNVMATAFLYSSDKQLKTNIKELDNSLEKILQLNGVSFNWKENGKESIGLIAQDVEKVYPELVKTSSYTGLKSLEYGNLVAPLIEAIKEQQKKIDDMEKKINTLQNNCQ
jgi:hypothetical protein